MSATQNTYSTSMSSSPPAPTDLGTYSRSMHQHTKRQMEAISGLTPRSSTSSGSSGGGPQQSAAPTGLPDGVHPRSRNSSECSSQT